MKMWNTVNNMVSTKEKALPLMYWIPKMHKNPIGARFIVASKSCSTKTPVRSDLSYI